VTDLCYALIWRDCEILNIALCHEEIYGTLGRIHTLFNSRGWGGGEAQIFSKRIRPTSKVWARIEDRNDRRHSAKFSRPGATWVQGFVHSWFILFLRRLCYSGDVTASRRASQSTHGSCGCLWSEVAVTSLVVSKTWLTLRYRHFAPSLWLLPRCLQVL